MIQNSIEYKKDLGREIKKIRNLFKNTPLVHKSEKNFFKLQKFLFVSSFLMRKLIESNKISDELESEIIKLEYADVINYDGACDVLSKRNLFENYQVNKKKTEKAKVIDLLHIFIHSYVFDIAIHMLMIKDNTKKIEKVISEI